MSEDPVDPVLEALRQALEKDPRNGALWVHYADLLAQAGRSSDAISALRTAIEAGSGDDKAAQRLIVLLRETGEFAEALIRAEKLIEFRDDPSVRLELARIHHARGDVEGAREEYAKAQAISGDLRDAELEALLLRAGTSGEEVAAPEAPPTAERTEAPREPAGSEAEPKGAQAASVVPEGIRDEDLAAQFDWGDLRVTFADVAGLEEVKRQIHLRIIAPFRNPEIYRSFRRQGGGGILLYGPPGCGKTFIARATAGECGARFVSVGIHDMIDRWWGESEKLMHALFEDARRRSPTVLFFDEFDALGSSRGHSESQFWRTLVDQLLQEMDGMMGRNEDVLIFAATNVPWHVDSAFRRPGRFDRVLFVPPPDETARAAILRRHAGELPGGDSLQVERLAKQTALFTGADLKALCERAAEEALARSLETGEVHPVTQADFDRELKKSQNSANEWLTTARNYARYANDGGQYDDLIDFLRRVRKW